ncbi:response regulator [Aquincola tertiaricarbonis]|uniref:response regulator n=1 Tax=Aquincola tertiaricarbonis TaxID=391953 RepID=UPI0006152177|nr:response regulator [Aquincola tertiaricarbonis]
MLLVDDDAGSLTTFALLVGTEGALVNTAADAQTALGLLAHQSYDVLVSDLGMPDMDGFALIAAVRQRWPGQRLRAVAVSGYGRQADRLRALEAGFDAFVAKPDALEDLAAAIGRS